MRRSLQKLLRLAPAPRGELMLSLSLGGLAILFGVGLMATAGYLIARAAERPAILSLTTVIVAVRFFGLARPLARYLERLVSHDLAFRVLGRLRVRFYRCIEPLAPGQLAQYRRGDLVSRMVSDVDALQGLYLRGIGPLLVALVAGAVAVGVAAAILPLAAVALGVGLVLGGLATPLLAGRVGRVAGRQKASAQGHLAAELVEFVRGAPELTVYGRVDERLARLRAADEALVRQSRLDALAGGLGDGLVVCFAGLTTAAVLAAAVEAHADGRIDRVLVAALTLLALASFDGVSPLPLAARELATTVGAGRRILELTDQTPAIQDPREPLSPPAGAPTVVLERVTAGYGGRPVLWGFDLLLEPGERVALVGESGAGKTTVTNLLLRFLDPVEGRVTLAGADLSSYRQEDVRRAIAVAGQDAYLFSTSIRENVRLGRPRASDAEVEDALRRARIWEWVATLPEGADTLVGEEGTQLSGGQRQRVAIARALLTDAPVLVLDEPTAHLDPTTARELVGDVLAAADGRSILLITHRPEGLELVDRVIELRGSSGRIESGP